MKASGLAGLHVHFFLATAEHGRRGDYGAFITSAEWMDVNYGNLVRELLLDGLGGESLHVLDPKAAPFVDATTTGAITCFKIGEKPESITVRRVEQVADLGRLDLGHPISRQRLAKRAAGRSSPESRRSCRRDTSSWVSCAVSTAARSLEQTRSGCIVMGTSTCPKVCCSLR